MGHLVVFDEHERFEKQSYRNRCKILTSNKVQDLIVPVQKGKTKLTSGQVSVIYADKWQQVHLRAIKSAYGKAPFFEHYYPEIELIIENEGTSIFELGMKTIQWAAKVLGLGFNVQSLKDNNSAFEFHSLIHPKKDLAFDDINAIFPLNFKPETLNSPYFQCFDHSGFVPNLSIIDLIMNEGPMAKSYLNQF